MDAMNQLMDEKTRLLGSIAEAAQRGDSQDVLKSGGRLEKVESLIRRYDNLVRDISSLKEAPGSEVVSYDQASRPMQKKAERKNISSASGRALGKTIRSTFLKELADRGIRIRQVKGTIFEALSGKRIGIAVASEAIPDRWFLGLPLGGFDHAILLCERKIGDNTTVEDFWFPESFFEEYGNRMSHSADQIKFNIARRGEGYVLLVPGTQGVRCSAFRENYRLLEL
ncbi:MAG: hypothetical protein P4L43_04490 [Syntrophobacteraceae bacterium]|nr:hypothetical protein [Syntrophobacteraceae bacterium]